MSVVFIFFICFVFNVCGVGGGHVQQCLYYVHEVPSVKY